MVIAVSSGPDWATVMTGFATLGAVIAAVGIAIWSNKTTNDRVAKDRDEANKRLHEQLSGADRRLREQLSHSDAQLKQQQEHSDAQLKQQQEHSDAQLKQQQEHSDRQLTEERAIADARLRKDRVGFVHAWVELDPDRDHDAAVPSELAERKLVASSGGVPRGGPSEGLRFVARNDGPLPVYNVVLLAPMFYEPEKRLVLANIDVGMLVPHQTYLRPAPDQMKANFSRTSPIPVFFTDSKGDRWQRDCEGELAESSSSSMTLDGFLIAWNTAPQVTFEQPGITDRTVLFIGQVINIPESS
jgi:hypothetical protein